jgi:hypothetical protein
MKWWQCWGSLRKPSCMNVEITAYWRNEMTCPVCGGRMIKFYEREDPDSND